MIDLIFEVLEPISLRVALVKAPAQVVAHHWETVQNGYTPAARWLSKDRRVVSVTAFLAGLLPLSTISPTRVGVIDIEGSEWSAMFGNTAHGFDTMIAASTAAERLGVIAMDCGYRVEDRADLRPWHWYGSCTWSVYDPTSGSIRPGAPTRSMAALNDGGRWIFDSSGAPFEFEDLSGLNARRIRDRFTPDMLRQNAAAMGVDLTAGAPYAKSAYVVERTGQRVKDSQDLSLEAVEHSG